MMSDKNTLVKLRKLIPTDAAQVAALCNNKRIWDCLRDHVPYPYHESDALLFIEDCMTDDPPVRFGVEYEGVLCGCIGLVPQVDIYRLSAEMGYWFGEPFWGRGIATVAVKLILEYGFFALNLERIYASVFDFNEASKRVLLKNGFELEGILKNAIFKNEKIINECRFGITKDDFIHFSKQH